ncbi:MAG TPA: 2-oxoglutarate dehydrogenase E1 component, partial [Paracoccaceae bacterium]|nr:2-oxoglutarate dehydrogenase E1 component [Paracoccaceae bacterium]
MSDAASNERFHDSSFLQGQNAAYVEQLYAAYARNPASVDPSWQRYFAELGDSAENVAAGAAGAPWQRPDWPPEPNDELTAAFDYQWNRIPDARRIEATLRQKS